MENKRILIVTQEMDPYLAITEMAKISRELPEFVKEKGMEIRVLMPRFGNINERRNRLHEVVRLSGINIIINDDDYPLIIKVASLPGARIQVYFLDNEDLFQRKAVFHDAKNKFFEDNAERMIFFCKGVLETVKKFGWAPDIIHCHGWLTSLIPLYVKTAYKKEPIFTNSKVVYSLYQNGFSEDLGNDFSKKIPLNSSIAESDLKTFKNGNYVDLNVGAIANSDAVIKCSEQIDPEIIKHIDNNKPCLDFIGTEEKSFPAYHELYKTLLNE